jgi:hypothetical protein
VKLIDRFLNWLKIKPKPTLDQKLAAWPFPDMSEDFNPRPCECEKPKARAKRKPVVKKATTRTVAKKTATKKKAK